MSASALNDYVGIRYMAGGRTPFGIDCYGLVMLVYDEMLNISLPDPILCHWCELERDSMVKLSKPADYCLVKVSRSPGLADHYGIYYKGYVLSAEMPNSTMVPLSVFKGRYKKVSYGAVMLDQRMVN